MSDILDFIDVSSNAVIITGDIYDINFDINFDLHTISNDSEVHLFFNMMSYSFLPLISLAARQSKTRLSLLDNVYCNNIPLAGHPEIIHDDLSDHFPIYITLKCYALLTIRYIPKISLKLTIDHKSQPHITYLRNQGI